MARADRPVIIEVALNGGTRKASNPNVPIAVDEIVTDALACLEEGASIVHQHDDLRARAKRGEDTGPESMAELSLAVYKDVLAERPDAIVYPTINWGGGIERRWGHHVVLDAAGVLRMALVDPGSLNLGWLAADGSYVATGLVYENSRPDIAWKLQQCRERSLGPNVAIFEPGFLRTFIEHDRAGDVPPGSLVKLYFGGPTAVFGLPPTALSLDAYLAMMDGTTFCWAVAVLGGDVIGSGLARHALERGGHLRVGLEDYAGADRPTNVELVRRAVGLCEEVGRPVASPTEAAELLGLARR
jgi:uncharacterized protein (DUF849 family)